MQTELVRPKFKLSKYLEIEQFLDQNDEKHKTLIFSTRTLKLLCVDTQLLRCIELGELERLSSVLVEKLSEAKILVPIHEDELSSILTENQIASQTQDEIYLVFQTSAACQLGCGYCGQAH